ncbi:Protein sel-1 1 [Wickerhamiella sorbophila]|uniref:Protein sel-1 1 n=1 Tax=Wickerhamiella sorbophila TaxID=45607 RepID=A0A2T0FLR4_9ASCO|nr:Protein sel-1 1 [Wickerhamiella sorbophila]PRT55915.1 Protein sel-1 1 [Wickerhamiella sorbophila]
MQAYYVTVCLCAWVMWTLKLVIALAAACIVAANEEAYTQDFDHNEVAGFEQWISPDHPGSALTSFQLSTYVPLPETPSYPWAYDRFSYSHLVKILYANLWQKRGETDDVEKSPPGQVDDLSQFDDGTAGQLFKIGECCFYGAKTQQNLTRAFDYYQRAAALGSAPAQFMMGLRYSTGVFGNFETDQAKALVYYTFAAEAGDLRSQMALGYRYFHGIGVEQSDSKSAFYYGEAADKCMEYHSNGNSVEGFRKTPKNSWIIADEFGRGVYDFLMHETYSISPATTVLLQAMIGEKDEILDQLEFSALEEDDMRAHFILTQYYSRGGSFNEPQYERAMAHANNVIDQFDRLPGKPDSEEIFMASFCYVFIGDRYRRGEGVEKNLEKAKYYYELALELEVDTTHSFASSPLGMMELYEAAHYEPGSEEAIYHETRADNYFEKGAKVNSYFGQVINSIRHSFTPEDKMEVLPKISKFAKSGPLAAYWAGALWEDLEIEAQTNKDVQEWFQNTHLDLNVAALYRSVCEWTEDYHSPIRWAQRSYAEGLDASYLGFLVTAEQGYDSAQFNLGDLLDVYHSALPVPWLRAWPVPDFVKNRAESALTFFTRAAQRSMDAMMKVADYYYYGTGTEKDLTRAFEYYTDQARRTFRASSMAYFNIAWMYEHGEGVNQDSHLAKRYYDLSASANSNAFLLVQMALVRLRWKLLWQRLLGVEVPNQEPEAPRKSFWEGLQMMRATFKDLKASRPQVVFEEEVEEPLTLENFTTDLYFFGVCLLFMAVAVAFRIRRNRLMARQAAGLAEPAEPVEQAAPAAPAPDENHHQNDEAANIPEVPAP